ncbi:MAG: transglutaminase family protein [Gemmobacter sp.]|uniref:transglutaminase family protein n=1 Tax=Gemmobacter sp. TaxID=1898957 RepID=UPI001A394609|nr:transglutaminase family protein [Gemmobacter sp.]MBL8560880.1 transglutaminase family protein [Gemmobacter sp.]
MRYDIRLTIDYRYQVASDHVRNMLRLLPSDGPNQRVTARLLTIAPPPDERRDGVDFFGNATSSVVWHEPVDQITLHLRATAERLAAPLADLSPPPGAIAAELPASGIGPAAPLHFLAPSPRIAADPGITTFTRALIRSEHSARAAVEAVGRGLHKAMTYDAEATDVTTTPVEAFTLRRGVCQDFAQIMIAGLRALGLPAAYVSGFLRTYPPEGQPRLEGVDAMHAWVAVWCGAAQGWVEYDPTNAQWAGEDYITVAMGRDYADVAPVKGAIRTAGGQDSTQAVDVIPLD